MSNFQKIKLAVAHQFATMTRGNPPLLAALPGGLSKCFSEHLPQTEIFEQASRTGLRFNTSVGALTTEDLWALPLQHARAVNLDSIAIDLSRRLKDRGRDNLLRDAGSRPEERGRCVGLRDREARHLCEGRRA